MAITSFSQLVSVLQLAIGPVILISGVGLLLLTLTNRFGRLVDRMRLLQRDLAAASGPAAKAKIEAQIDILLRRASLLRISVLLGAITVLLVPVLIVVLFLSALFHLEAGTLIIVVFLLGQAALVGSMFTFIQDMNLSLKAVRLETER